MEVPVRGQVDQEISESHARVHTRVDLQNVARALQRQLWEVTEELSEREREWMCELNNTMKQNLLALLFELCFVAESESQLKPVQVQYTHIV